MEGERLIGILTKSLLLSALHDLPKDSPVREALSSEFLTASADDALGQIYRNMISKEIPAAAVIENGNLLGMITLDQIAKK
jgi:CBS domain-containing protein